MMTHYTPANSITGQIARRLRPFQNRREIAFTLDRPLVSISFDDFPISAIENGSDVMETHGWRGTFYTSAALERVSNHHGVHFSRGHLTGLQARGHEIAGHTLDHVDCTTLSQSQLINQIEQNKTLLRAMGVTQSLNGFAYPFGAANSDLKQVLSERFDAIRGIHDGVHRKKADLNELKACGIYSDTVGKIIARIQDLARRPAWLILFTHDICPSPSQWGCTPGEFDRILLALKTVNAQVLPVRDAVALLRGHYAQ
ncbi:polysaccharide deacetylase family protein [Robiginitomaculum antarcticum]|uniref:polysaccharide deacetylase family protein n=1 Tax=Robiginitomaculum antarcticum TaxID=437507 RepID=UPI00037827A1|nr:polysaccharide deacetylase family protein [Robiginitomaculum antarcticum]